MRIHPTLPFWTRLLLAALTLGLVPSAQGQGAGADDDYDRLDGVGRSGKTVNVIEWEGNLEIHVYPAGSLTGLALKLDQNPQGRKVMVIGYRFNSDPKQQLIRRAVLGIPFSEGFRAWRDRSARGYDKIVVSNQDLGGAGYLAYGLEKTPTQLYPDGHPALARDSGAASPRKPASADPVRAVPRKDTDTDSGTIRPFGM